MGDACAGESGVRALRRHQEEVEMLTRAVKKPQIQMDDYLPR